MYNRTQLIVQTYEKGQKQRTNNSCAEFLNKTQFFPVSIVNKNLIEYGCWNVAKINFMWYQNIFLFNQNQFIFKKVNFHDINIQFHSIEINFY